MTVNITKIVDWRRPSGRWVANAAGRLLRVRNDDLGREGFLIARAWIESRRRSRRSSVRPRRTMLIGQWDTLTPARPMRSRSACTA